MENSLAALRSFEFRSKLVEKSMFEGLVEGETLVWIFDE